MTFNPEKARESLIKLGRANLSLAVLTREERDNLIAMLDNFVKQEGWPLEEMKAIVSPCKN